MPFSPKNLWLYETPPRSRSTRRHVTSPGRLGYGSPDSGYESLEESVDKESPFHSGAQNGLCGLDGQHSPYEPRGDWWQRSKTSYRHLSTISRPPSKNYSSKFQECIYKDDCRGSRVKNRPTICTSSKSPRRANSFSPDRFLPFRTKQPASERYQATKALNNLSTLDKFFQRDFAFRDPFEPRPRQMSPTMAMTFPTREYPGLWT